MKGIWVILKSDGYLCRFAVLLCCLCAVCPAWAIILHPDNEPNLATWIDRPSDSVVGRWGSNASCVVIARNYIITTRHQGDSTSTIVTISGVPYTIDTLIPHPTADLKLVKLNNAYFTEYASVNNDSNEVGQDIVLGGYGDGRKDPNSYDLKVGGISYGYAWDNSDNTTQRWGTNKVAGTSYNTATYTSELIVSQFDESNTPGSDYECAIGEHDSGGGWFRETGNGWEVIGLSRAVAYFGESWFLDNGNPPAPLPEYTNEVLDNYMDAVRISSYADWIRESIHANELQNLALNWLRDDCDAGNNFCQGADVVDIGTVNMLDFAAMASMWF